MTSPRNRSVTFFTVCRKYKFTKKPFVGFLVKKTNVFLQGLAWFIKIKIKHNFSLQILELCFKL
jgi:hypothetical protein